MTKYPQTMINIPLSGKTNPCEHEAVRSAVADAERTLADQGRVLLRPSGTEPLLRVMVEGRDLEQVKQIAQAIADTASEVA